MVMLQKSFNNLAFLFFVPLVFIAVIKSKFTEEHNSRKKDKNFMGETPEEKERKEKKEKSRINRKIKGFIRARLFEILEKVRKKLEPEDNSNILLRRPMSVAGALRRDIFEEDKEFNKSIVSEVNSPNEDEKEDKDIFIKNEQADMDEESSFHASSKESEESGPDKNKDNNRSSSGSGFDSDDEGPDRRDKQINVIKSNKFISKNSTYNKMGFEKAK